MIPRINDFLIRDVIQTENMVRAGQSYWLQGRVSSLDIDAEMGMITADVRGSAGRPYEVSIIFDDEDPEQIHELDCSCPVGFGCKHCAAVLYAVRSELSADLQISAPPPANALPKSAPIAKPAPLPQPLLFWLSESQNHEPMAQANAPEIAYVLSPHELYSVKKSKVQPSAATPPALPYWISVKVWSKQPNPDGRRVWSEANRYDRFWPEQAPTPLDAWLIKRLNDYHGDIAGGTPKGIGGADWIDKAIATGRVRWRNPDGPRLHICEGRDATFRWMAVGAGEQRLTLEDVPAGMMLIALVPPLLIDADTGAVHRIETGVEASLAERLLRLPPVPPHAVAALAEQWGRVAGDAVPPPALHNLIDRGMITPTPVLTFREEGVDVFLPKRSQYYSAGTMKIPTASARLSFDYAGYPVTHATDATLILNVTDEGTVQFQRDLAAEERAFARIGRLGLKPIRTFHEAKARTAQVWDLAIQVGAVPAHYADILQNHVPRLHEEGWRIAYAPRWSLTFVEIEPDTLSFDVEPSGVDWFDISLGARIDGKAIDILPLLRRLLGQHGAALLDHPGEILSVEIAPGKLAQVPMDKIRPVLEMLLLFALHDLRGNERLRLPARDLAALAEIESSTNTHIPWTGAEPLRALAKALVQMELTPTKTPKSFTATLRPYQQQGLDWLQALHGAGFGGVLADDMGLGKTVQALAHITTLKAAKALEYPVLIVCPTSVLPNWQAELAQFAPKLTTLLWHGTTRKTLAPQIAKHDVILTSYPLLARDIETLKSRKISLIIYDEAQMLKHSKSAGFKAAKQMKATQLSRLPAPLLRTS
jgi:SNF2-related domain/SWIM zinc finger